MTIRRSKTDCEGRGRHLETDPVAAVQTWIADSGLVAGPLFRRIRNNGAVEAERLSDHNVARNAERTRLEALRAKLGQRLEALRQTLSALRDHTDSLTSRGTAIVREG